MQKESNPSKRPWKNINKSNYYKRNNYILSVNTCKNYLQIKGCAMGTICESSYANIFMDHFERNFVHPFIKTFSLVYLRFIDDVFFYMDRQ